MSNLEQRRLASNAHKASSAIDAALMARSVGETLGARGYDQDRAAKFAARWFDPEAFDLFLNVGFWSGWRMNYKG